MLRFGSTKSRSIKKSSRRLRWRIWTLWIALGFVLLVMKDLQRPETARRLGQLFPQYPRHVARQVTQTPADDSNPGIADAVLAGPLTANVDLSAIKDNTHFRPTERPAWIALFAQLQTMDSQQLDGAATDELTYAQLLGQPEVYRGQLVTVRGTVLREEIQPLGENNLGVETYHRLWLKPDGGGQWPLVVYALDLPEPFPRGNDIRVMVSVRGFFFKNWSYPLQDGFGLAPVVLARGVQWTPPVVQPAMKLPTKWEIGMMMLGATAFAGLVVWCAIRSTRRTSVPIGQGRGATLDVLEMPILEMSVLEMSEEEIQQQLKQLSQTGGDP